ncbi:hypothetical protein BCR34DRAFT_607473 [Clohesyomyces aquaticus]|uniref:Protein kinase domain-containing protein n=1 Tax=Clohesyomyces aquaticus TaxID=1231657 RepID=A0A1Y1YGX5_9PLEO|nr:hypothetical protein BCR34DRAFT_607473 [Clohesyomyces aquaticus]
MDVLPSPTIQDDTSTQAAPAPRITSLEDAFSTAQMIIIHPGHCDLGDYDMENSKHMFAVKRLHTQEEQLPWQEVAVLKHFRHVKHIVPLLATYTSRGHHYLIFPWDTADLRDEAPQSDANVSRVTICPTYHAPECGIENGKISRKTDVWILSCTFLEFVTWFLMRFDAVANKF